MVDGRWLMRDGRVLTLDEPAIVAEADRVARAAWRRLFERRPELARPAGFDFTTRETEPGAEIDHHADRHLERQFAEGAAREGCLVARAREAGRGPDAGDQTLRRPRAGRGLQAGRLRARPPR